MFKKITIIIAVLALLLTIFYGIALLRQRGNQIPVPEPTTPLVSEDGSSLFLPSQNSNTPLLVPNFLSPASALRPIEVIKDEVSGSTTALLQETDSYSLYGFSGLDGSSFMVALHAENLRQARLDGEQALLTLLGITPQQACTTNITVVVESPYNSQILVSDVRPSFCPDWTDLPTEGASEGFTEGEANMVPADTQL